MWEWYFPHAELHFVDSTNVKVEYHDSSRINYHIFNQTDVHKLVRVGIEKGPFDIIIDHASYAKVDMIHTFKTMFPFLRPGGIYVFEDYHAIDYDRNNNYKSPIKRKGTVAQFAKDIIDVQLLSATSAGHFSNPTLSVALSKLMYYARRIESIQFYVGLCFVMARETIG